VKELFITNDSIINRNSGLNINVMDIVSGSSALESAREISGLIYVVV